MNYWDYDTDYMYSVSIWATRLAFFLVRKNNLLGFIEISGLLGWIKYHLRQSASMAQFMSEKVLCWISY